MIVNLEGDKSVSQQQGGHHRVLVMAACGLVTSFHPC